MTSYFNSLQHSSNVSEVSSTSPSPASCNTSAAGNNQRFGTVVPNRVFVGGIASNTTESELRDLFGQYGNVKEINIISDRGGVCKGYGFVTFETEEEAKRVQHEPDTIVLKERRLNIGPAVIKQQPFTRPYDMSQQGGTLLYHNGTPYTYQHGMAYFSASPSAPPAFSVGGARETMYTAPFGHGQTTSSPAYPSVMYPAYAPSVPYITPGQQYPFSLSLDYLKSLGQTPSQFIYTSPSPMNGSMNGGTSQSPSPSYGQQTPSAPPQAPAAFYHVGSELYYNGNNHPSQPQILYPMEPSPASQSEDWRPAGPTGTPVVSLLKLQEAGSVEEMEITRTPKKPQPGPGGPRPRAPSLSRSGSRRPGRGAGRGASASGQRSASSSRFPSTPNSCLHRSSSVSPSGQVSPAYSGGRQHQVHQQQGAPHVQGQSFYHQRRGGNPMRSSGSRSNSGMPRSSGSHHNSSYSSNPINARMNCISQSPGQNSVQKSSNSSKNVAGTSDAVNGSKVSPSVNVLKLDKGGAGDAPDAMHVLPMSPPDTPLSQGATDHVNGKASDDASICQKMQALAV